jgi:hypothetical protein
MILSPPHTSIRSQHHYDHTYDAPQYHYHHRHQQPTFLQSTTQRPATNQDWSINAIEEARQQLEHLIGPMIFDDPNVHDNNNILSMDTTTKTKKKPHLLTNAGRKRRNIEIRLLQSLQNNDDAIDELMTIWIHECPHQIVNIDIVQFMSSYDSTCTLQEAEIVLRNILQDCPVTMWSEPGARLAYILFVQEQYDECEQYVEAVLSVKPWHFEMIQLQILLALQYHHSMSRALHIARQYGLPPLHHRKHRSRWVQHMTELAQNQLQQLEYYTASELHDSPSSSLSSFFE